MWSLESRTRITGYASMFAILAGLAAVAGAIGSAVAHPRRIVKVHFPELGTLMMDDPVAQEGVPIGKVRDIIPDPSNPAQSVVEIELLNRAFIPADSRFVDFNHSLMGARTVVLVPGRSRLPMDESRVQEGFFAAGFTETLHKVGELLNLVVSLRVEIARLFVDPQSPWSPHRLPGQLDHAIAQMQALSLHSQTAAMEIHSGADALIRAATVARKEMRNIRVSAGPAESGLESALAATLSGEKGAESVLRLGERFLAAVQDSGIARNLLYETTVYEGFESALHLLEAASRLLRRDGLRDIIQYRRNVHLVKRKPR